MDAVALRLATIAVYQLACGSGRKADIRPLRRKRTGLYGGLNDAGCDELVVSACAPHPFAFGWRNELGDHAATGGYGDALPRLDLPDVVTQVILELTDTSGNHVGNIATCGHQCKAAGPFKRAMSRHRRAHRYQSSKVPEDRHAITAKLGAFKTSMLQDAEAGRATS
jgi:hypothetical protein